MKWSFLKKDNDLPSSLLNIGQQMSQVVWFNSAPMHHNENYVYMINCPLSIKEGKQESQRKKKESLGLVEGGIDENFELYELASVLGQEKKHRKTGCCRPSCLPIAAILILIFLVVLFPLVEQGKENSHMDPLLIHNIENCNDQCRVEVLESIPEGLTYPNSTVKSPSIYDGWMSLLSIAENNIDIASFYWTLLERDTDKRSHPSADQGRAVFEEIKRVGAKGKVKIRIAQNYPSAAQPNYETDELAAKNLAQVRSLNFLDLMGNGVLHTKLWIVDGKHFFVGSANMDWRALTQVKELGVIVYNCSCLANDVQKIFEVYWELGRKDAVVPLHWPNSLATKYNSTTPLNMSFDGQDTKVFVSSSPVEFCPEGRTDDLASILDVIESAEKFIYISVMDYFPRSLYSRHIEFWPVIDDALRKAALERKVHVRLLASHWNSSRPDLPYHLLSLSALNGSLHKVRIETKLFTVPTSPDQADIPFARVNHAKYMVTDNTAYIGTSNWSKDYFTVTGGVGLIIRENGGIRQNVEDIFLRDWFSPYARVPIV